MSGNPGPQYIMRSMQHCWQYRVAVLFFLSDHTRSCKIISTCRFCARFLQSRGSLCNIFMLIFRNTAYWDLSSAFEVRVVRQKNDSFWPSMQNRDPLWKFAKQHSLQIAIHTEGILL